MDSATAAEHCALGYPVQPSFDACSLELNAAKVRQLVKRSLGPGR